MKPKEEAMAALQKHKHTPSQAIVLGFNTPSDELAVSSRVVCEKCGVILAHLLVTNWDTPYTQKVIRANKDITEHGLWGTPPCLVPFTLLKKLKVN